MEKQENKEQISNLIKKVLDNSYVDLKNYSIQEMIDIDFLNKFKSLGVDTALFEASIKSQGSDKIHSVLNNKYNCFCILNNIFYYIIIGEGFQHRNIKSVSDEYRKINLDLINKLIEYKKEEITIKELAEFLRDNKIN